MALETGTYLSDLVITNPVSTDGIGQADDHLRLLKKTLKNSFPSITGAVTATQAELNVLDGITSTTAELNLLDGVTWSPTALNGLTSTVAEINKLDGFTGTVADLNYAASLNATGVTSTEFDRLDGLTYTLSALNTLTATAAELNKLDGALVTTAEINKLSGATVTTAELNKLSGFTGTVADLNYASALNATGVTSTEFDYLDGVTSNIQTQLGTKANLAGASFTGAVDVNSSLTANSLVIDNGASDWSFEITSNVLYFKYAGVSKAKLDTSGNLTVVGNITAYGTV